MILAVITQCLQNKNWLFRTKKYLTRRHDIVQRETQHGIKQVFGRYTDQIDILRVGSAALEH